MTTVRKQIITWLHTQSYWVQKAAELLLKDQAVDVALLTNVFFIDKKCVST